MKAPSSEPVTMRKPHPRCRGRWSVTPYGVLSAGLNFCKVRKLSFIKSFNGLWSDQLGMPANLRRYFSTFAAGLWLLLVEEFSDALLLVRRERSRCGGRQFVSAPAQ